MMETTNAVTAVSGNGRIKFTGADDRRFCLLGDQVRALKTLLDYAAGAAKPEGDDNPHFEPERSALATIEKEFDLLLDREPFGLSYQREKQIPRSTVEAMTIVSDLMKALYDVTVDRGKTVAAHVEFLSKEFESFFADLLSRNSEASKAPEPPWDSSRPELHSLLETLLASGDTDGIETIELLLRKFVDFLEKRQETIADGGAA